MFYLQIKTGRIKIKVGDFSDMFIINNLGLNNQALIIYQTVCPDENMSSLPIFILAQWQKIDIY